MANQKDKRLFNELEAWSRKKDAYSINDFLREWKVSFEEFECIANRNNNFMKIWRLAEAQAWKNVQHALFTKSLPRSKIAQYIKENEEFQKSDPEEVMRNLESGQEKLELYEKAMRGDIDALMKCSLIRGMITQEAYEELIAIADQEDE